MPNKQTQDICFISLIHCLLFIHSFIDPSIWSLLSLSARPSRLSSSSSSSFGSGFFPVSHSLCSFCPLNDKLNGFPWMKWQIALAFFACCIQTVSVGAYTAMLLFVACWIGSSSQGFQLISLWKHSTDTWTSKHHCVQMSSVWIVIAFPRRIIACHMRALKLILCIVNPFNV